MARTRAKEAAGEPLDEMDYSPDEEISIAGGLSHNGKPAELVRKKDGKVIPLSERSTLDAADESPSVFKRSLSEDEMDDDEAMRSMARRRKSDKPGDVMHACRDCKKEFKRPCDLTKHEKTHSRPWKCHVTGEECKYQTLGWPTEKERDRHYNDKHMKKPTMYKCMFPPCPYSSKRESNCKQHMEKAHNWQYVRSKSNGRNKKSAATSSTNGTPPEQPFMATPASVTHHNFSSPESPFLASPSVPPMTYGGGYGDLRYTPGTSAEDLFTYDLRRESVTTAGSAMTYSSGFSPDQQSGLAFDDALTPEEMQFNHTAFDQTSPLAFDFNAPIQQPTPAMSINHGFDLTNETVNLSPFGGASGNPHLSPLGQADMTLYSPHQDNMHFDEALGGDDSMNFNQDFTLFETTANTSVANIAASQWFPDMNFGNVGGQFDSMNFAGAMDETFSSH